VAIATQPTSASVDDFLDAVSDERRRTDGNRVRALMGRVTGEAPVMWGASIVGFGDLHHRTTSGEYDWFVVGFSPRKGALTIYGVYDDYGPPEPLFDGLGPHTTGKGCLYLKRLDAVDEGVLELLIRQAWDRARGRG
jgi:hypothetical protein